MTATLLLLALLPHAEPLTAGLRPGQRPGPYSAHVAVGPQRGQLHCFVCETGDRPAAIVFAHTLSDPLAQLLRGLDKALIDPKSADLRAWVTLLADDPLTVDPEAVAWARRQALRNVPIGIFADVAGPPAYRLHRDADVTVLLSVKQKVVRAVAFRPGELTAQRVAELLRDVAAVQVPPKP